MFRNLALLHIEIPLCYGACSVILRTERLLYTKKRGNRLPPFPRVEVFALPNFPEKRQRETHATI